MRIPALFALLTLPAAHAQPAPAPDAPREQPDPRRNQKIEHIVVEDRATRVDELRVGGETVSVTVRPKGGLPAYEMTPGDFARGRPVDGREPGGSQRVWNVLSF